MPEVASVGWWSFWRLETFEEPESRPSRTEWTKRASGKIRPRPPAAAIVKQLISTSAGLPSSSASGPSSSKKRSREASTTSSVGGRLELGDRRLEALARGDLVEPADLRLAAPARGEPAQAHGPAAADPHAVPPEASAACSTNSSGVVRPSTTSARPFGLQWKRHSIGTAANRECSPSRLATTWVPLRPVPPTKTSSAGSRRSALMPPPARAPLVGAPQERHGADARRPRAGRAPRGSAASRRSRLASGDAPGASARRWRRPGSSGWRRSPAPCVPGLRWTTRRARRASSRRRRRAARRG